MSPSPTITVLMAVYNGERYLRQAMDSILRQSWTDFEFLIINDGSTDSTGEILESYQDKRLCVIHTPNQGLTKALRLGIDQARGEFVARMDADDISLPHRLALQRDYMYRHEDAVVIHGLVDCVDGSGRVIKRKVGNADPDLVTRWFLLWQNRLYHSTAMIRKQALNRYSINYRTQFRRSQDYDLWCSLSQLGAIVAVPEAVVLHRVHPKSISHKKRKGHLEDVAQIIRDNWSRYGITISKETAYELTLISEQTAIHPWVPSYGHLSHSLADLFDTARKVFCRKI